MEEKEKKILRKNPKELSRREFLKDAGLVVGGTALGSIALVNACAGETTQTVTNTLTKTNTATATITAPGSTTTANFTSPPVTVTSLGQTVTVTTAGPTKTTAVTVQRSSYIQWKAEECMACSRCLVACAAAKEGAVALQLSAIRWEDEKEFSGFRTRQPLFCQQCSQPECYYACPLKDQAMCIDAKTGARYVNKDKCNGCGICVLACPFEVKRIGIDEEKKKAIKCDLCKDRADGPVCIGVCDRLALSLVKAETRL